METSSPFQKDPSALTLVAGDLEAVFLPRYGMLAASLRHRHVEILRRVQDLEVAAAKGSTAGIPLLHPWANRLAGPRYRTAGREVVLDLSSPLLHFDEHGLPMHGVPWSLLAWELTEARQDRLAARLEWSRRDLLAVFPFRHRLELVARLPELPRADWQLQVPAMRRLVLDRSGIPTGEEEHFGGLNSRLGELDLDDGYARLDERPSLPIAGAGRRIIVELLTGYAYAQIFAPKDKNYVALEPMTAPTNALTSGRGLQLVNPGGAFRAAFRIRIETAPRGYSHGSATLACYRKGAGKALRKPPLAVQLGRQGAPVRFRVAANGSSFSPCLR
jgi:aldose 1-epimerase